MRPNHDLEAVVIELPALEAELVLGPEGAINFVLAIIGSVARLRRYGDLT